MKLYHLAVPAAFTSILTAGAALAGPLAAPLVEPTIIVEDAASSSMPGILPLLLLGVILAAVLGGAGAPPPLVSDRRLKTDIARIGTTAHGLPLYRYRYKGFSRVYEGVMAQDVVKVMPEAVVKVPFGIMLVDYGMLGIEMKQAA
ncbi:MAG TPA: tail fiber domain-containing protein [Aliiroseovarius sp.]|nr:tail fiber domain-containing protein [Aliiroseovarius sp.]